MEQVTIPKQALDLLINVIIQLPYKDAAPVLQRYEQIISEAQKDGTK